MAMFGGMPGYGGGMFPATPPPFGSSIPQIPDYMSGINASLARNEQVGAEKSKKFDFGKFLGMWAGHLGDSLTGNPVYANSRQQREAAEAEERSRRQREEAEKAWWYEQQQYNAANEKPDYEGNIDHYRQSIELGYIRPETTYPDFLRMVNPQQFVPPAPLAMEQGDTIKPAAGGVTAVNPQTGERVRYNPQTGQWEPAGGAGGNAGGSFRY